MSLIFITLVLLLCFAAYMYIRIDRVLRKHAYQQIDNTIKDVPSVSVCIPARNETHAMTQCIERVLASDYSKMEVLVFDDESADDTSFLIRSFAHAGVRFVTGPELPVGWLGKNHALEVLAREASGKYIFFIDVDTHITPTTISNLMQQVIAKQLVMTSVIPGRNDMRRLSVVFGHLRYYWQLLLSSESHPAASSSLWMIRRSVLLETIGGFISQKAKVQPEVHIASIIGATSYQCFVNTAALGVTYEKRWNSQRETSRRLLYPMSGGTRLHALAGMFILIVFNLPMPLCIVAAILGYWYLAALAGSVILTFGLAYARYTYVVWDRFWWLGVVVWPVVVFQELLSFMASVDGYARNTITWKGRSVVSKKTSLND